MQKHLLMPSGPRPGQLPWYLVFKETLSNAIISVTLDLDSYAYQFSKFWIGADKGTVALVVLAVSQDLHILCSWCRTLRVSQLELTRKTVQNHPS